MTLAFFWAFVKLVLNCALGPLVVTVGWILLNAWTEVVRHRRGIKTRWELDSGTWGGDIYYYPTDKFDPRGHFRTNRHYYIGFFLYYWGVALALALTLAGFYATLLLFDTYHHLPL